MAEEKLTIGQIGSGLKAAIVIGSFMLTLGTGAITYGVASGRDELRIKTLEEKMSSFEENQSKDHDKIIRIDANVETIKGNIGTLTTDFKQFMRDHPAGH